MPADTPQSPWGNTPEKPPEKKPENTQHGNPFGHDRPPYGQRPHGGGHNNGPNGPDLEQILRHSQERLRHMMQGDNGNFRLALIVGAFVILFWLASGFYRVQEGQIGVVLRFGEVTRTEQPGLRYHLPSPIETALTPNVTFENRIEIGFRSGGRTYNGNSTDRDVPEESTILTSDQNIVDLDFAVTWVVKDPSQFLFEIRDPETTVKRAAESAMREVIGQTEIQSALTDARDRIQQDTKKLLQQILDDYKSGVEIVRVELLRVNPPASVVDAFNDVQRAEADRERLRNEAEGYRNRIIPEARGEAERLRNEAEGYKQQAINAAKGEASRFGQVLSAYSASPSVTAERLYLETMESVLKNSNKVVVDGNKNLMPFLPLDKLAPKEPALPSNTNNNANNNGSAR